VRKSKHKPKPPRPKPARAQNLAEPPPACAVRSSLENALANLTPDQRKRMCGDGEPLKRMAPVLAEGAGYHITEEDRRIIDRAATEERRLLRKIQAAMSAPLSNPAPEAKRPRVDDDHRTIGRRSKRKLTSWGTSRSAARSCSLGRLRNSKASHRRSLDSQARAAAAAAIIIMATTRFSRGNPAIIILSFLSGDKPDFLGLPSSDHGPSPAV
jgi:hypothetical protein